MEQHAVHTPSTQPHVHIRQTYMNTDAQNAVHNNRGHRSMGQQVCGKACAVNLYPGGLEGN